MTNLLLELQHLDTRTDELRAQRAGLPQRAQLRERESTLAGLAGERSAAADRRATLAREERAAAALVADLAARAREVEDTLYSGRVKAIRELEALQAELRDCQRRLREREEEELVLMESQERVEAELAAIDARRDAAEREAVSLRAAIEAAEGRIDAELVRFAAERTALLPPIAAPVLTVYEKLRSWPRLHGKVAVSVSREACGGCNTVLPKVLVSRLQCATVDEVVQCLQCQRILVSPT